MPTTSPSRPRRWHWPNILTCSRLGLAALLLLLLSASFPTSKLLAFFCFLVASLTDWLDGYLARRYYGESAFGKLMDPLTDKVLVCAAFVGFVELRLLPAWMAVIIISREFLVTGLRLLAATHGRILSAGRWGKHKTVWQIVVILALLLGLFLRDDVLPYAGLDALADSFQSAFLLLSWLLGTIVVLITVLSGSLYFREHRDLLFDQMAC